MAARLRKRHQDDVRAKIGLSQLITRLNKQALDSQEMSDKAIKATEILLRKCLPDLKALEHTGSVALAMPDAVEWRKR